MKKEELTKEEKLKLLTGKDGWRLEDLGGKLPEVFLSDGPNGLRKMQETGFDAMAGYAQNKLITVKATAYPNLSMVACSWNPEMAYLMGSGIADDCIENDVAVLLAPGVNLKRTPLCGRNFEYLSEDPFLAGECAYQYIRGVQDSGVGTSLKHFALNNGEDYRLTQNSEVEERAMRELYLPAFERALEAKPWTVMCSYNMINGVYASENKKMLSDILRGEFGFDGVIVSDWCAVKNRARALKATLDLEMPYSERSYPELVEGLEAGYISEKDVDDSVERVLTLVDKATEAKKTRKVKTTKEERYARTVKIAEESIVLLKNEDDLLPLKKGMKIDVYFDDGSKETGGGGSAKVEPDVEVKGIGKCLQDEGFEVIYHGDAYLTDATGDVQLMCVNANTYESEGYDRRDLLLKKRHEEMILNAARRNKNVVVAIYAGSAVEMSNWIDLVRGVLFVGFCGEGQNEALARILAGKVNPSGKLAQTFPESLDDLPVDLEQEYERAVYYRERFAVGYRYYDWAMIEPLFPFGYGRSYAKFEYSDLEIKKNGETDYEVSYTVKNVSNVDGKEISQVYVGDVIATSERPEKELKGFSKDLIKAGESKRITVKLGERAFAFYNPSIGKFYVENGKFVISVGASSADLRLQGEITVKLPKFTQMSPTDSRDF